MYSDYERYDFGGVCGRNHEQSRENKLRTVTGNERTKRLPEGFPWEASFYADGDPGSEKQRARATRY